MKAVKVLSSLIDEGQFGRLVFLSLEFLLMHNSDCLVVVVMVMVKICL